MARDAELDRLKVTQDAAFSRKQSSWEAQDQAWKRCEAAKSALEQTYQNKQSAYASQESSWQAYLSVKNANGPRIDSLNAQQEAAYQSMVSAFNSASSAHDMRDGASAKMYANEGHAKKAEAQGYVAERRRLVAEIRAARERHEATKPAFQGAKAHFGQVKNEFDRAKEEYRQKQAKFQEDKAAFEKAKDAFQKRLEAVQAQSKQRNDEKRVLAEKAGVPLQYRDNVYVTRKPDGSVNIYFGGMGSPDGPGHGHYVLDGSSQLTYSRDPYDQHGAHNYADVQRDYSEVVGWESTRSGEFGFNCTFRGYYAYVESNTNSEERDKIDIYYGPNGPFGPGHHHAVAYRETPYDFIYDELRG